MSIGLFIEFARLAALGLGEVLAVRTEPREPDRAPLGDGERVDIPHALAVVIRLRVVERVHGHGFGVVVDGDVDVPAERKLDAARGAAAAREVVDDEFALQVEDELVADHAAPSVMPSSSALFAISCVFTMLPISYTSIFR